MGRANVYLPDDLERRVRAAAIPISEVCQRALLAAVEQAETGPGRFGGAVLDQYRRGHAAGTGWASNATQAQLLTLLRDQRFAELPAQALPADLYALTEEESLGWEAGFTEGARSAIRLDAAVTEDLPGSDEPDGSQSDQPAEPAGNTGEDGAALGDDSGCQIGSTLDGGAVCFDPHAAVRAAKSPLFAILGEADSRARLTLSIAQDAAARGTGVIVVDLSGELSARAAGLGRNIRVIRTQVAMPQLDDLVKGAIGLGGLWQTVSNLSAGSGLLNLINQPADKLVEPGHVTILDLSGDNAWAVAMSSAHGLSGLLGKADFPRLVQLDLAATIAVPEALAGRLGQLIRTAREQNVAVGVSAQSASTVSRISGGGALLSTIFAMPTASPAEADRLRALMGATAPVLLNPPGSSGAADDQTWAAMRDLHGRLGQLRIDGS